MTMRSLLPAALLLIGCSLRHRPADPERPPGPARDSLFQVDQSRGDSVAARGVVDGSLALLSPDVAYLRAGVPTVYGRDAARALLSARGTLAARSHTWQPLGGGVSSDRRSGYTYGIAAYAVTPGPAVRVDRYIAFWQRDRAQLWRIVAYAEVNGETSPEVAFAAGQLSPLPRVVGRPLADMIASVRAADSVFSDLADRRGTGYAFSNTVADVGVLFSGPHLIVGPKAVDEFYRSRPAGSSLSWRPVHVVVAGSGDLGFTVGEYIATGRGPSGAAVQRFGKYLTVWKRQPDGSWKFVVDGGNETPARAER
jgi:ketosteroid isomerase-like protein